MKAIFAIPFLLFATGSQAFQFTSSASVPEIARQLQALDAAVRAACPDIDGIDSNGNVAFRPSASAGCRTAAAAAVAAFVPIN